MTYATGAVNGWAVRGYLVACAASAACAVWAVFGGPASFGWAETLTVWALNLAGA